MASLLRTLTSAATAFFLSGIVWQHNASAAELERAQIEQIIQDYLMKNPEVIAGALAELQRRDADKQAKARGAAVESSEALLLSSPHQAVLGNPDGNVTVVEFFDYNCHFCRNSAADVQAIINQDPKVRVVLKEWPILGPESVEAARVSIAARMEDGGARFRDFHEKLLTTAGRADKATAIATAAAIGYDVRKIQSDLASDEVNTTIAEGARLGNVLSIEGTPTFVVGGQVVSGAIGVDALKSLIGKARDECKQKVC